MANGSQPLGSQYKTALVTGASSGIGAAVAQRLLVEGVEVYGSSRDPQTASGPEGIQWLRLEGGTADGVDAFIEENRGLLDRLDILINNAGSSRFGSLADNSSESLNWQLQLLLETPVRLTQAVLAGMQSRGNGCILNVSSLAASFPLPFMAAYSAGKAGLSTFTQSLILSEAARGVALIDFQAGDFRTAFNEHMARPENLGPREQLAMEQLEKHLQAAPEADVAARDMIRAIRRQRSCVVRSGGVFQTWIAPMGVRILPVSCLLRAIQWYYKLPSK